MQFLYLLEKIRNPVFDFIFSVITHIGGETVFLAVALFFFWCIGKREGYYLLITGLIGTIINQAAKLVFKIPRPWVKDPDFTIVESARAEATGYSFPSGHTQNVTGTFGVAAITSKRIPVRIISMVIIVLVAFSRMYLGVHTPLDVGVSLALGTVLVFVFYPCFKTEERFKKTMPYIIAISFAMALGLVLFVFLMPSDGVDAVNLSSGMKNASTLLGCTGGLVVVYTVDSKFADFQTDGRWYAQAMKFIAGIIGVLLVKEGMKAPLLFIFKNEYLARGIRYFLVVMFAGCVWPLTFKFFSKLRIKALERKEKDEKRV